jgi:GntR family transcriptional repressor for pyruvate dehydrogenase complex
MEFMKNRNAEGARSAMRVHIMHAIDQLEINKNQGNNKA